MTAGWDIDLGDTRYIMRNLHVCISWFKIVSVTFPGQNFDTDFRQESGNTGGKCCRRIARRKKNNMLIYFVKWSHT